MNGFHWLMLILLGCKAFEVIGEWAWMYVNGVLCTAARHEGSPQ